MDATEKGASLGLRARRPFRIVAFVALLGWSSAVVLPAQDETPAAPVAANQQSRGKKLYLQKCAACHQENLLGTVQIPPLSGDIFWMNWEAYNAYNLLWDMEATMPENNPGGLELQQYVDIVAYVLKFNQVPMTGDLPLDTDGLKKVVIRKKP